MSEKTYVYYNELRKCLSEYKWCATTGAFYFADWADEGLISQGYVGQNRMEAIKQEFLGILES